MTDARLGGIEAPDLVEESPANDVRIGAVATPQTERVASSTGEPERTVSRGGVAVRAATPSSLEPGSVVASRYQIEAVLGRGGTGTVFRAWDRVLGEPIAMKILHGGRGAERSWIKRLAREVKIARAIRHPNVCRVFELGHANGHWFVTMELAQGGALRDSLRNGGLAEEAGSRRPFAERLADAQALAAGLAAIHAVGIIHRDVTPQNVLRMSDGRLVLSDFGLAIEVTAETTVHGGTPSYMPPETALGGRADQRSDVWQLGVIWHELLFGSRPGWEHVGDRMIMTWPLAADASTAERELARLCRDCLAGNPERRPATAIVAMGRLAAIVAARDNQSTAPRTIHSERLRRLAAWRPFGKLRPRYVTAALIIGSALTAFAASVSTARVPTSASTIAPPANDRVELWQPRARAARRRASDSLERSRMLRLAAPASGDRAAARARLR